MIPGSRDVVKQGEKSQTEATTDLSPRSLAQEVTPLDWAGPQNPGQRHIRRSVSVKSDAGRDRAVGRPRGSSAIPSGARGS